MMKKIICFSILIASIGNSIAANPMLYPGPTNPPREIWMNAVVSYNDYLKSNASQEVPGLWFIDDAGNWVPQRTCQFGDTVNYIMYLPHYGHVMDVVISKEKNVKDRGYLKAGYYINTIKPLGEGVTLCYVSLDGYLSNVVLLVSQLSEKPAYGSTPGQPGHDAPRTLEIPRGNYYTVSPDGKSVAFSGLGYPGAGYSYPN